MRGRQSDEWMNLTTHTCSVLLIQRIVWFDERAADTFPDWSSRNNESVDERHYQHRTVDSARLLCAHFLWLISKKESASGARASDKYVFISRNFLNAIKGGDRWYTRSKLSKIRIFLIEYNSSRAATWYLAAAALQLTMRAISRSA